MFKPNSNVDPIEVLTQPEQRRRRSVEEKFAIVRETFEPGASVSGVARRHRVNANHVFARRKLYQDGRLSAVSAGEQVVPASDLAGAMSPRRLQVFMKCAARVAAVKRLPLVALGSVCGTPSAGRYLE